tara:strand:- start:177 stop:665 length:489 start_codon:yes stop_codon:yes gene_type:complete
MAEELKSTYVPAQPGEYQGKQIIINSDRVLFNAKEDAALIYANKAIGLNCQGVIAFDVPTLENKYTGFIVNSPKIYLGLKEASLPPTEPATLANQTQIVFEDLCEVVRDLCGYLNLGYNVTITQLGTMSAAGSNGTLLNYQNRLDKIVEKLDKIKSKNVKLV